MYIHMTTPDGSLCLDLPRYTTGSLMVLQWVYAWLRWWQILWKSRLAEGYTMWHCTIPLDMRTGSQFTTGLCSSKLLVLNVESTSVYTLALKIMSSGIWHSRNLSVLQMDLLLPSPSFIILLHYCKKLKVMEKMRNRSLTMMIMTIFLQGGTNSFLWNVGKFPPDCTVSYASPSSYCQVYSSL